MSSVSERGEPSLPRPAFNWGAYEPAIRRWEAVLMRPAPMPVDEKGRLAPAFVEWMMGFPEGWTSEMSRTQALKALGNAVVPQQGMAALARLLVLMERAA
jgi:DNA (cytosine-5)-methyltransferase 1